MSVGEYLGLKFSLTDTPNGLVVLVGRRVDPGDYLFFGAGCCLAAYVVQDWAREQNLSDTEWQRIAAWAGEYAYPQKFWRARP